MEGLAATRVNSDTTIDLSKFIENYGTLGAMSSTNNGSMGSEQLGSLGSSAMGNKLPSKIKPKAYQEGK
jgi:hypothetical protein